MTDYLKPSEVNEYAYGRGVCYSCAAKDAHNLCARKAYDSDSEKDVECRCPCVVWFSPNEVFRLRKLLEGIS